MANPNVALTAEEYNRFFDTATFSWLSRTPAIVPPVRRQEETHTCWAFVATSTIYSAGILNETFSSATAWMGSVEEIVTSCITPETTAIEADRGPTGSFSKAYEYVKTHGVFPEFGIAFMPPFSYGRVDAPRNCRFKIGIRSHEKLPLENKFGIKQRILEQPIATSLRAGPYFEIGDGASERMEYTMRWKMIITMELWW